MQLLRSSLSRFAWEGAGHIGSFVLAFTTIVAINRAIGLEQYGRYVLNLILLSAVTLGWNIAVREAAAAALAKGARQRAWDRHLCVAGTMGLLLAVPIGSALGGTTTALFIGLALIGEGLSLRAVPALIADGGQRRIAIGNLANQGARLLTVLWLVFSDALTPDTALVGHILGYIVAAAILGKPHHVGYLSMTRLWRLVPVDALKWIQLYVPILGAAYLVGLRTAGGFDLILRLVTGISLIFAATGPVTLPKLAVSQNNVSRILGRALRLPTLAALGVAALFALTAEPLLSIATGAEIGLEAAPLLLASIIALSPWFAVMRTTLLVAGRPRTLISAQAWTSSLALLASMAVGAGVNHAALLLAVGAVGAATMLTFSAHKHCPLPRFRDFLSFPALVEDLRALMAGPRARMGK